MRRRIKKANIKFISLVPKGANQIAPVFKSEDGSVEFQAVSKFNDEKGELTAVVYAPEIRDSQGDIAGAEVIKEMAYDYVANGAGIDIRHDGKAVNRNQARVAETFLVQKNDDRFHGWNDYSGNPVNLTGAWATIIKIDDEDLRKKYRSGEWSGVSMGGTAVVEQEKSADIDLLCEKLSKALNLKPTTPSNESMDKEDLKGVMDVITKGFEDLQKALVPPTPAPKPEPKPVEKTEPEAPKFVGKDDDERALTKHARKLELFNLKKGTDWNDPKSVVAYREQLTVLKEEWAEEDAEAGIEEDPVEDEKPARKARTVAKGKIATPDSPEAQIQFGQELADMINKQAGFAVGKEN